MDLYEELVHVYLTVRRQWFVWPQAPIRLAAEDWEAWPDFLAIDFDKRCLVVVQVTKSRRPAKLRAEASKLQADYRTRIEEGIRSLVPRDALQFPVSWMFFVRGDMENVLRSHPALRDYVRGEHGLEVITLEKVFNEIRDVMP